MSILGEEWSNSHCGVKMCDYNKTIELMPEVKPILDELIATNELQYSIENYLIDVKVHLLLPKQFPCIPDWHCDFVPRDANKDKKIPSKIDETQLMYLWVSNAPYTEFRRETKFINTENYKWRIFTQRDVHRGIEATERCWRCFIRLVPLTILKDRNITKGVIRRHSQVYLDANNYRW